MKAIISTHYNTSSITHFDAEIIEPIDSPTIPPYVIGTFDRVTFIKISDLIELARPYDLRIGCSIYGGNYRIKKMLELAGTFELRRATAIDHDGPSHQ